MTEKSVLIVGAGVFGLSTAYELLQDGYKVTIVEQSDQIPSESSSSTVCAPKTIPATLNTRTGHFQDCPRRLQLSRLLKARSRIDSGS